MVVSVDSEGSYKKSLEKYKNVGLKINPKNRSLLNTFSFTKTSCMRVKGPRSLFLRFLLQSRNRKRSC